MLPPEIIEKIRREKEEVDRAEVQIPLYVPDFPDLDMGDECKKNDASRVIVIDLL